MRAVLAIFVAILPALFLSTAAVANASLTGSSDISFTRNDGQFHDQVRFRATSGDAFIWFTDGGVRYSVLRSTGDVPRLAQGPRENLLTPPDEGIEKLSFGVTFVGANPIPDVIGVSKKGYHYNYFIGNDPSQWKTSVPSYDTVLYHDIYPGIDMKYYANADGIEYTFVLSPGADPSVIRLEYEGVESLNIGEDGQLVIATAWGNMTEKPPVVYQMSGGCEVEVAGSFAVGEGNSFGFALEDYNPELALVIDPVITFSTYFGGSKTQYGRDIAIDQSGNVVIVGHTYSLDFPMVSAYQDTKAGATNTYDLFISKFDPETGDLLYSTFYGGNDYDRCRALALDNLGNIYVACQTMSRDMPTVNAYQENLEGGSNDVYVFKLNSAGDHIDYATYLGGNQNEVITGLAVDNLGCAYVCGTTESSDFDLQIPFQPDYGGGDFDGFVTKFSPSGNTLIYGTYLGGDDKDEPRGISVNANGEAYVVGNTYSCYFPTHSALYPCQINAEGPIDAFITKFSAAGNAVEFSTFFGGTEDEWIEDVAIGDNGDVYLFGCVESDDFPVLNAIQEERCPGGFLGGADLFVSIINGDGDALVYSTYLGGHSEDFAEAMALGPDGSIYLTGVTFSTDFPVVNYFDASFGVGDTLDAVVARIAADGSELMYSSHLGGNNDDWCWGLAVRSDGSAAVCGDTKSTDFPLVNSYMSTPPYNQTDVFITVISGGCCTGVRGNFDGDPDNILDILDIYAAIGWTFEGGPAPSCLDEADTNGDGIVTIEDLVRLVNYIYGGAPVPATCD